MNPASTRQPARKGRGALYAAIIASAILILRSALQLSFLDLLTSFVWLLVDTLITFGFLAVLVWALVHAVRGWRRWRTTSIPLALCLAAGAISLLVPFTDLWLKANFAAYRSTREAVVTQVLDGTLRPNVDHNPSLIALDGWPFGTSAGGNQIVVERHEGSTYVFFFAYRETLDSYGGYLFVSGDGDPALFQGMSEPTAEITAMDRDWYFESHW